MDEWDQARGEWMNAAKDYRRVLGRSNQVGLQQGFGEPG